VFREDIRTVQPLDALTERARDGRRRSTRCGRQNSGRLRPHHLIEAVPREFVVVEAEHLGFVQYSTLPNGESKTSWPRAFRANVFVPGCVHTVAPLVA
jgi:hypothetical protein